MRRFMRPSASFTSAAARCTLRDGLQLVSQHILRQRHGLCKAVVRTVLAIPPGIVRGDDIGQLVAAARIIVQIQRLYKALVKAARRPRGR